MSQSLTIFAVTELTADQVDAAPGIEPPPWSGENWCTDLEIAREYVRRLNLKEGVHVVIKPAVFDSEHRITSKCYSQGPLEPHEFSVACLDLDAESKRLLVNHGYYRLGMIADMSWKDCKRIGVRPDVCRLLQKALAKHGLSMSFECFPGERYGWSLKRRSA